MRWTKIPRKYLPMEGPLRLRQSSSKVYFFLPDFCSFLNAVALILCHLCLEICCIVVYNVEARDWIDTIPANTIFLRGMPVLIYIDESGSINNHNSSHCSYFVIALVHVKDKEKTQRAYKRFVSSNLDRLRKLDVEKKDSRGRVIKPGGKMFNNGKFCELKGSQFDADMKRKFLSFFAVKQHFEVFYIKIANAKLSDKFCSNTARVFNYPLKLALGYFIRRGLLPNEECLLQLDERNEKTETKYFLEEYLNTELIMNGSCNGSFKVKYFDSENNKIIQLADVYANWFYSHLQTGAYSEELKAQQKANIVRDIFEFPL